MSHASAFQGECHDKKDKQKPKCQYLDLFKGNILIRVHFMLESQQYTV